LTIDPATEEFTGQFAKEANALDREFYREGFALPNA
jgi:hypothetical protein